MLLLSLIFTGCFDALKTDLVPSDIEGYTVSVDHFNSTNPSLVPDYQNVTYRFVGSQVFGDGNDYDALSESYSYTVYSNTSASVYINFGDIGYMEYELTADSETSGSCTFTAADARYDTIYGDCSYYLSGGGYDSSYDSGYDYQ